MIQFITRGSIKAGSPDLNNVMAQVRELMGQSVLTNFMSGGRPSWASKRDGTPSNLYKTGNLLRSIQMTSGDDWAKVFVPTSQIKYAWRMQKGGNFVITPKQRGFFLSQYRETKDPKWRYMAFARGGAIKSVPRPYMMFQEQDKVAIKDLIRNKIVQFYQS